MLYIEKKDLKNWKKPRIVGSSDPNFKVKNSYFYYLIREDKLVEQFDTMDDAFKAAKLLYSDGNYKVTVDCL